MDFEFKDNYGFYDLVKIMAMLRAPGGCPWDAEQTHQSIRQNFIEETYEAIEAIDTADTELLKEELGDVMLQVVFHSAMEQESGSFSVDDVCDGVCKKLIVRHPHVFGDVKADTSEEVLKNWDKIKMQTKSQKTLAQGFAGISGWLPALIYADKVFKKAAKYNLCVKDAAAVVDSIKQQTALLDKPEKQTEETIGNLLLAISNLCTVLGVDSEKALADAAKNFAKNLT